MAALGSGGGDRAAALIVGCTFLIRAAMPDQPLVENYVGRQIPTAMVARNLERGSGLLRPRLDTAPSPNYFLVEPPLYECGVVTLRRASGMTLGLGAAGRLVSALATALAAWAVFDLSRRRDGRRAALLAASTFALFPVTIRYGRAFQPDAAMLGAVAAGLSCWDRTGEPGFKWTRRGWAVAGWVLLATGLAMKIIAAPLLLLPVLARPVGRRLSVSIASVTTMVPALLWYAWAAHLAASGGGSRASTDNAGIWIGLLSPWLLLHQGSWVLAARFLLIRAFTPIGAALAIIGLACRGPGSAYWRGWAILATATLAALASKLHHEYYFLLLAPAAAAGVGRALDRMAGVRHGRWAAMAAAAGLLAMAIVQARTTWRTPPEWVGLEDAARIVARSTPPEAWVVAPEALLFASDRRGCRLEWSEAAARRAAGEWGDVDDDAVAGPIDLVDFYRARGARYFADLGDRPDDPRRLALHDDVRRRYKVMIDRPEVLIADLGSVPPPG